MDALAAFHDELTVVRSFYALHMPRSYPGSGSRFQAVLVDYILENRLFMDYPPAPSFQLKFWKAVIKHLESSQDLEEVDSRLYDHLLSLMSTGGDTATATHFSRPPAPSFITYIWRHPSTLRLTTTTLLEARTTVEAGTTGLRTWGACLALCQYFQGHAELIRDKRILELGCGTGLMGIVLSRLGASHVVMTDCSSEVLEGCQENVRRGRNLERNDSVEFETLDWFDSLSASSRDDFASLIRTWDVDIVVGSDIVYAPEIIEPLVATVHLILSANARTTSVQIALTLRREDTFDKFISVLHAAQLQVHIDELIPEPSGDFLCTASEIDASSVFRLVHISLRKEPSA
ncbi:hypothetical protein EXIGLDRAFT_723150 [Exidia glandulosa HHB12029]|uniref:S-adenosyl-L-methionine-dependent methyltransferase n=1 Tax=Exidia glandulosa HHB12029 TaxID=1314781 RepID=A0A165MZF9_EXIGL|nr:hypothetical protein EXIGLDRAFT_723150 [Exidia glandulosa HHB12029]